MKFDARVIGIPNHLAHARRHLPRADFVLEQSKLEAARARLAELLPDEKLPVAELFRRPSDCISHFQCERAGFLQPLQEFACFVDSTTIEDVNEAGAWTASRHIVALGAADALVVPFDLDVPLTVDVPGRSFPYRICSAPRINRELEALDEYVAIEHTMGVRQFDAFVMLSAAAMERFERREGVGRRFWAKWGVAALRGLVMRAIAAELPVIVDPYVAAVPVTA